MLTVYCSVRRKAVEHKGRVDESERRSSFMHSTQAASWRRSKPRRSVKRNTTRHDNNVSKESRPAHKGSKNGQHFLHSSFNSLSFSRSNRVEDPSQVDAEVNDIDHVISAIEKLPSAINQTMDVHQFASNIVFWQSALYTVAFYVTFTFGTINRLVYQFTGKTYFALLFLHVLLVPLQGFLNVLIYRYGFYLRLKQRHPHMSHWELLHHTYRWTFLGPPLTSASLRTTTVIDSSYNTASARVSAPMTLEMGSRGEIANNGQLDDSSIILEENNGEDSNENLNVVLKDFITDLVYSYTEYPNLVVSHDDLAPIVSNFPRMVEDFSTTSFPPLDPHLLPRSP